MVGRILATWVVWGLAAVVCGFANLAVMGFHPIAGQQIVNYGSLPVALLLAAVAAHSILALPRWSWVAWWLGAAAVAFAAAPIAGSLAPSWFPGVRGPAGYMSAFALIGAAWAAGLALVLPGAKRWPGLAVAGLLALFYVWASSWNWAGADGELFGSRWSPGSSASASRSRGSRRSGQQGAPGMAEAFCQAETRRFNSPLPIVGHPWPPP